MFANLSVHPGLEKQRNVRARLVEDRVDLWNPLVHVVPIHPLIGDGRIGISGNALPSLYEAMDGLQVFPFPFTNHPPHTIMEIVDQAARAPAVLTVKLRGDCHPGSSNPHCQRHVFSITVH
ncbi:uncharacterized protein FPRN_09950 [Fusarium proliferatum]|nr:uncharacterized protein FPRN_09950 [Fusarium proliferatum]